MASAVFVHPVSYLNELLQCNVVEAVEYSFAARGLMHSCTCNVRYASTHLTATSNGASKKAAKAYAAELITAQLSSDSSSSDASSTRGSVSSRVSSVSSNTLSCPSLVSDPPVKRETPSESTSRVVAQEPSRSPSVLRELRSATSSHTAGVLLVAIAVDQSVDGTQTSIGVAWTREYSGYTWLFHNAMSGGPTHKVFKVRTPEPEGTETSATADINSFISQGMRSIDDIFFIVSEQNATSAALQSCGCNIRLMSMLGALDLAALCGVSKKVRDVRSDDAGIAAELMLEACGLLI